MRNYISYIVAILVTIPGLALAAEVVYVPSSISLDATFVKATDAENAALSSHEGAGADGACAVVQGKGLVCGTEGSKLRSDDANKTVVLEDGGFSIHAGKKAVTIGIDSAKLTVKQSVVHLVKIDGKWVIAFVSTFRENATVTLETTLPVTPATLDNGKKPKDPPAPTIQHVSYKKNVLPGQTLSMAPSSAPVTATDAQKYVVRNVGKRLKPKKGALAPLIAINVEHEDDLEAAVLAKHEAFEDIEIEDIEVEAGCIEVCLD